MTLSKEIARERKAQGKSLRELGRETDLSRSAIWNAERNNAPLSTTVKVAKALGIKGKRLMRLAQLEVAFIVRAA